VSPVSPTAVLFLATAVVLVVAWEVFCLRNLARADRVRYLPKWAWVIVCLISIPWGGLVYLIVGRDG
jgi:hypothetical protein